MKELWHEAIQFAFIYDWEYDRTCLGSGQNYMGALKHIMVRKHMTHPSIWPKTK